MKIFPVGTMPLAASLLLALGLSAHADLIHRYNFDADANDSVGTAHGTLQGSAFVLDGALTLDGSPGTYVSLPGGLLNGLTNVTIEFWATYGVNANWVRLFDFGDTDPVSGAGRNYLFFTPHSGSGDARLVISDANPGYNHEEMVSQPGTLDSQGPLHIACVVDPSTGFMALYTNGILSSYRSDLTIQLTSVSNVASWIGRSLYNADTAMMAGTIDEFRIYNSALNALQVAGSYASGPGTPSLDPGALQSISLQFDAATLLLGGFGQASVSATFEKVSNVGLAGMPGITYMSGDTNILTIATNGAISAIGLGSTTITVAYQDKQDTKTVNVVQPQASLIHRYSFGELAGTTALMDAVGLADGNLLGSATFTGDGKLTLDGTSGTYVDLPNGIISSMTDATFETWVTWNGPSGSFWQQIFNFGSSVQGEDQSGTGQTYLFLTPWGGSSVIRFAATIDSGGGETPVLNGSAPLPVGTESHVVVVYNYSARVAKLFVNGALVASGAATIPLKSINDINNWLGRSQGSDPYFNGQYNEFRIYEGALTDFEVALSAAAGPDVIGGTNPGALESATIQATNAMYLTAITTVMVLANYANVSNVNVTVHPDTTIQSTDSKVLVVGAKGQVEAVGLGTAAIVASFQGKKATNAITVTLAPGDSTQPVLVHRYSFSEPVDGYTVKDSVGSADGQAWGTGNVFTNGNLVVTGGAVGSGAGYVDLPNGIISALTNATFETWLTWNGPAGSWWQRIFDFGVSTAGEDSQGTGASFIFLTPMGGQGRVFVDFKQSIDTPDTTVMNGLAPLPVGEQVQVVVTYNYSAGVSRIYVNGQRVATGAAAAPLSVIDDRSVWLGRSQYNDPFFAGKYNEFRIYNGALDDAQVAANYGAGPDSLNVVEKPKLTATFSRPKLDIRWPTNAAGYVLQFTTNLGAPSSWTSAGNPTVEGELNKVQIQTTEGTGKFYRLKK